MTTARLVYSKSLPLLTLDVQNSAYSSGAVNSTYRLGFEDEARIVMIEEVYDDQEEQKMTSPRILNSLVLSLEEDHVLKVQGSWLPDLASRFNRWVCILSD